MPRTRKPNWRNSPVIAPGFRRGVPSPAAGRKFPVEVLSGEEVRRLIKAASPRSASGIRARALIAVMYRGGLRVSEVLGLYEKDLDRDAGSIRVLRGKGSKARTIGIDSGGMGLLDRWLDHRGKLGLNGRHPIFCTLQGKRLWPSYVRALLPRLAERAGIEKRCNPHALRHSHAAELAEERLPVNLIQQQLGHANLSVTSRYLNHIMPHERVEILRKREWTL